MINKNALCITVYIKSTGRAPITCSIFFNLFPAVLPCNDFGLYYSISPKPMVTNGMETILGVQRGPRTWPIVLFDLGGIFGEVFKAWRPVRRYQALILLPAW